MMYDHIMQEEIFEAIDAIDLATDFGGKFISDNQVILGGFEKSKQELMLVEDLVISANGTSCIAAKYGAHIMRHLGVFDTVKTDEAKNFKKIDFKDLKYGGFLTVSQSGYGQHLSDALKMAYESHLTCFNIVNVEDSPITQVVDKIIKGKSEEDQPVVLIDSDGMSDFNQDDLSQNKNIGLYQKTGHCYSDIKSFMPQIICLTLVALWFSYNKQKQNLQSINESQDLINARKQII